MIVFAAGTATADAGTIISLPSNTLPTSQPTQTGRLILSAVTRTCAAPNPSSPSPFGSDAYHYRNHTFRSSLAHPVCITVDLTTSCVNPNDITSASYAGVFTPANPGLGYAADMGFAASTTPRPYSFTLGSEAMWSTVVSALSANTGCTGYALTLSSRGPWAQNRPAIGGIPTLGTELTSTATVWNDATSTSRQWRRCDAAGADCVDIAGATGATYTVTDADIGRTLRIRNQAGDGVASNFSDSPYVEPFIALQTRPGEAIGAGDRVQLGQFIRNSVESRCAAPTTAPAILSAANPFLSDTLPSVTSVLNESVCLVARVSPMCPGGVTPSIYSPTFLPASSITTNYAANSGINPMGPGMVSWTLPSGGVAEVVVSQGQSGVSCPSYGVTAGTAGPFATARPTIGGTAAEGVALTSTDGTWTGSPAFSRSWRRCDAAGSACAPIDGATGASYTPTAADAGSRLRLRVSATRGLTLSSDSAATEPVTAAPPPPPPPAGAPTVSAGPPASSSDVVAPTVRLRLPRTSLQTVVRRGYLPVAVTCSELCTLTLRGQVTQALGRRLGGARIANGQGAGRAGRAVTVRLRLTRKARRALRRRSSVRFVLRVTAADAARNSPTVSRTVRLTRARRR